MTVSVNTPMPSCAKASVEGARAILVPLLSKSPDPHLARNNLERLLASPELPAFGPLLESSPLLSKVLVPLLGSSQFLGFVLNLFIHRFWITRENGISQIADDLQDLCLIACREFFNLFCFLP